jgi:hypothetical protein
LSEKISGDHAIDPKGEMSLNVAELKKEFRLQRGQRADLLKTETDLIRRPVSLATASHVSTFILPPVRLQVVFRYTFRLLPITSSKGWSIRKSTDLSFRSGANVMM